MSQTRKELSVEQRNGSAWIRLDRPERMNAFDRPLYGALFEAIQSAAADHATRAIVLTGTGRAFSAGADLKARAEDPDASDVQATLRCWANPVVRAIRAAPQPVIAALNGPAVGIGCSIALACDIVVAARSAYLVLPFANVGLGPDGGASLFTVWRAGAGRAAELLLLGERVSAERAQEWGLVNRAVPDDRLEDEVTALAQRLSDGAPAAQAATKRLLNRLLDRVLANQLALEAELQGVLAGTGDHAEGLAAFGARRAPIFTGA